MSQPPFQLTSLIDLQTSYLNDLDPSNNAEFTKLQNKLNELNTKASGVSGVLSAELSNLSEVDRVLTSEKNDLNAKKDQVDTSHFAKMRELSFIESRRKRQAEFTNMYYVAFIALILYIVILVLSRFMGLSENLQITLAILIFAVAGIIISSKYLEVRKRDRGDYDKLSLTPPVAPYMTEAEIQAAKNKAAAAGKLTKIGEGETCGQSLCGAGTKWDVATSKCVPISTAPATATAAPATPATSGVSGFTTIEDTQYVYDVKPFESNKKSSVYTTYA